jgi:hypothetical protein
MSVSSANISQFPLHFHWYTQTKTINQGQKNVGFFPHILSEPKLCESERYNELELEST